MMSSARQTIDVAEPVLRRYDAIKIFEALPGCR